MTSPQGPSRRKTKPSAPTDSAGRHARGKARRGRGGPSQSRGPDHRLFGLHAVREAWLNPERVCHRLWATDAGLRSMTAAFETAKTGRLRRPAPETVPRDRLDRLAGAGAVHQGVVLEADPLPPTDLEDVGRSAALRDQAIVVMLDQVTDPHNIGAILRSAAAFGALAIVVTARHTPDVTGTLAKSASGAVEHVPMVRVRNLAQALGRLKEHGFRAVGLAEEAEATLAEAVGPGGKTVIVLGAEGAGLRHLTRDTCDALARLPTGGSIASLNVSNAAAVALYELRRGSGPR
ncbi:MAG: 23S rRNA (guanosine(2251)-2'-O)-methyltransferase RlmB [Inquilinus sp.]|nr:23S rRNA (guanosine(2251)-2'-O)-methyltransferase RlmB [Inquilinus sp.]